MLSKMFRGALALSLLAGCGDDPIEQPSTCGNGLLDGAETCDDANTTSGDGCSAQCALESGWTCAVEGLPCTTRCGDGVVAGLETCDDQNTTDGDGCSASCQSETLVEVCDDGVDNDNDTLVDCADADCASVCGGTEICDDGIDNDGDSLVDCADSDCDSAARCQVVVEDCQTAGDEDNNGLSDCDDPTCNCECGNGVVEGTEQCDDGDGNSNTTPDACRTTCMLPICGDQVVDMGEDCDPANDASEEGEGSAEGSGSSDAACELCRLPDAEVCGDSDLVERWVIDPSMSMTSRTVTLDSSFPNDISFSTTCEPVDGADGVVEIVFATPGVYAIEVRVDSATGRVAAELAGSCAFSFLSDACFRAAASRSARFVFDAREQSVGYLALDISTQALLEVRLNAVRYDTLAEAGGSCTDGSSTEICPQNFECVTEGGAGVCAPVEIGLSGPGEPCVSVNDCLPGLLCPRGGLCERDADTTCDSELGLDDLDGETVVPGASFGDVRGTCGGLPNSVVATVDSSNAEFVIVEAVSDVGLPVALSYRENCASAASESACRFAESSEVRLGFYSSRETDGVVVVESFGPVSVNVSRLPLRATGESCDSSLATNRCSPGLACVAGSCAAALAGSCADPSPGFLSGEGDLLGRGFLLEAEPSTVESIRVDGCSEDVHIQVFEFVSPATGLLSVEAVGTNLDVSVRLTDDCLLTADAESVCPSPLQLADQAFVTVGSSIQVQVAATSDEAALVSMVLVEQGVEGNTCSVRSDCREGLECVGAECSRPVVDAGFECSVLTSRCVDGFVCALDGSKTRCVPAVSAEGEPCRTVGVVPTCEVGLECKDSGPLAGTCAPAGGAAGEACTDSAECAAGLACVDRFCFLPPGESGETCDPDSPRPCETGLECLTVGVETICGVTDRVACATERDCENPTVCIDGFCELPLAVGEPCSESDGIPCATGLECSSLEGGPPECRVRLRVSGEACSESAQCQSSLYCFASGGSSQCTERRGEGSICSIGGDERQCTDSLVCALDASFVPRCQAP